ncbi:MAG: hypothetical protein Q8K86_08845 [Candidatus Nanopelagicaceae bacterium]|nr:hypothetical protein [Candidatus Nanopelagicaceae bacterium]
MRTLRENLSGEWWLDEGGQPTFADGDISDANHQVVALQSALGIDLNDASVPEMIAGEPLSDEAIAWLRQNGSQEEAIEYLKDGSDPRDYALEQMGWIRVKDTNFQVMDFNDEALSRIADFIHEELSQEGEPEESEEEVYIEQLRDHKTWSIPVRILLADGATAVGLKQYAERYRGYNESKDKMEEHMTIAQLAEAMPEVPVTDTPNAVQDKIGRDEDLFQGAADLNNWKKVDDEPPFKDFSGGVMGTATYAFKSPVSFSTEDIPALVDAGYFDDVLDAAQHLASRESFEFDPKADSEVKDGRLFITFRYGRY